MTQNLNCQQLSTGLDLIRKKRDDFINELNESNADCFKSKSELIMMIEKLGDEIWSLEILDKENIEKQHNEWLELYKNLDPEWKLPSKERIFKFLQKDIKFIEIMKTKEKQGLTKMIIAPAPGYYSLRFFADEIRQKIKDLGGDQTNISNFWFKMFAEEPEIRYFGSLVGKDTKLTGGLKGGEIMENPDSHSICDGWIVSFTTDERNLSHFSEPDESTGDGRIAIKTNLTASQYQSEYFSDNSTTYKEEESMIPQEYLALFLKDLYQKYIAKNKIFSPDQDVDDLLDNDSSATWFISTYLPDQQSLPIINWTRSSNRLNCNALIGTQSERSLGVRSVVRRNLNK